VLAGVGTIIAFHDGTRLAAFRGDFQDSSRSPCCPACGLVMNPDAEVQFHGFRWARSRHRGPHRRKAALRGSMIGPLPDIPANVIADIAATTVLRCQDGAAADADRAVGKPMTPGSARRRR
jgi:hypothetical protein